MLWHQLGGTLDHLICYKSLAQKFTCSCTTLPPSLHGCTTYTHLEFLVHHDLLDFTELPFSDLDLNVNVIPRIVVAISCHLGTEDSRTPSTRSHGLRLVAT